MSGKKKKKGGLGSLIGLIVSLAVMAFALSRLIPILYDYNKANSVYDDLGETVVSETDTDTEEELPDWAKVTVDFDGLKAINQDVIGWIRFDDLDDFPIDYPILYADDNDTYLRHDLYGEEHTAGSIFLETLNASDLSDRYNILYGHNMRNGSMFGSLKKYKNDETMYEKSSYFTIYTRDAAMRYQIFAYEEVNTDSSIYTVGYGADEVYQALIDSILSSSLKDTGIVPSVDDRIVTLSTCSSSGSSIRFVVHAVCVDQVEY